GRCSWDAVCIEGSAIGFILCFYDLSLLLVSQLVRSSLRISIFFSMIRLPPTPTLFPYTTLFRSQVHLRGEGAPHLEVGPQLPHRSEEHTSELQSPDHLVCRLLLEKKN